MNAIQKLRSCNIYEIKKKDFLLTFLLTISLYIKITEKKRKVCGDENFGTNRILKHPIYLKFMKTINYNSYIRIFFKTM